MAGTFTFTSTGTQILNRALLHTGTPDLGFLDIGSISATKEAFAADILADNERDILASHPTLNRSSATQVVSAGTRILSLPSGMNGLDLEQVQLVRPDGILNNLVLLEVAPSEGQDRPGFYVDNFRSENPAWYYWDTERNQVLLQYAVGTDTTFRLTYRLGPQAWSTANLSTAFSRIPDQHIDTLYLRVAGEFSRIMRKPEAPLLMQEAEEADKKLSDALIGPWWRDARLKDRGYPGSTLDGMAASSGRQIEGTYSLVR